MANSFNGIGTTFYGRSNFESDGSFVTTKWFIIGFFPIVPVGSARIQFERESGIPFFGRTSTFEVIEELPIDWLQVLKTWVYAFCIVALSGYVIMSDMPAASKLIGLIAGVLVPHILRWIAKSKAGVT